MIKPFIVERIFKSVSIEYTVLKLLIFGTNLIGNGQLNIQVTTKSLIVERNV